MSRTKSRFKLGRAAHVKVASSVPWKKERAQLNTCPRKFDDRGDLEPLHRSTYSLRRTNPVRAETEVVPLFYHARFPNVWTIRILS